MKKSKIIKSILSIIIILNIFFLTGCKGEIITDNLEVTKTPLSTWIWDATQISKINIDQELENLNIDEVYINTGWESNTKEYYLKNHRIAYSVFIKELSRKNIKVQALLENSSWVKKYEYDNLKKQVKVILDYNENYKNVFQAIHLNVQPDKLNSWEDNKKEYLLSYIDNLKKIKEEIDKHNNKNNDKLKLVIDIPFWYANKEFNINNKNVIESLLEIVDEIVLMTYTQDQKEFIEWTLPALKLADNFNQKSIRVAMNFQENTSNSNKEISLYEFDFNKNLNYVDESFKEFNKYKSFTGFVVNDYDSYISYIKKELNN